jgi:PAS domain S-box-containing protein
MERFTGYSRGEMMHLSLAELGLWEDDEDRLRFFAEIEREGQVYDRPFQFRNAQRERMSVQLSGIIIELNGERCLLSSLTDVTPLERTRGELQRVNRALRTINACGQIIAHARDEESLVRQHCTTIVRIGGYHLAWVAYANRNPEKTVTAKAWAGVSAEIAQSWRVTWGDDERGQGPTGTAIRTGRPVVSGDMLKDPRLSLFRKGILQLGLRSEIALPIRVGEEVIGSLAISTSERHAFETEEVNLLARLADDLGFGIRALRERERKETAEVEVRRLLTEAETSRSVLLSILEDEIRSETALRASEEQFRSALEHSPIGMGLVGLDGCWIMVNEAFCNLMGYDRSEILQRPFEEFTHPDDREAALERMKQLREEKLDACEFEKRYVHKQGNSVWVRANVSLVRNPDGTPRHFIKQIQDITERRKAEQALVESNRRYARHEAALSTLSRTYALAAENLSKVLRDIVEVVAWTLEVDRVGVWTYNKSRTALVCLEFFQRPTNRHSEGQELTRKGFESYFSALEASEVVAVTQVSTDPRTVELASAYLSPSGVGALLDTPIRSREGKSGVLCCEHLGGDRAWTADEQTFAIAVANLLSLLFSQLEQQSLQAQLRHTQKLEALGTLAGGIAHDFNNILGAIISFTEIVRMDHPQGTELRENLGEVLKACNRATGLVRQILAFSRRQDPIRVRMQLEPVVREALKLIRSTLPASISIQEEIAEGLPSVLADSNQIHQVVVNLCANAEYAMRGSPGVLKVSLEVKPGSVPKGSQWLHLSIADTGHGMSEALLQRIFDPFFTTKGPGEGTGLGLAVVHGIIQEHKGTIEVESRPGVGTTFRISFPASESESRERVIDLPRRVPGTGQRILFVDDEVALLNSARPLLEHQGFRVDACANPSQALERLRQDPAHYDAVVSDLTMPGLSGLELAREIRSIAPRVPILIMTGYAGDLTTDGVKQLGLSELVLKPIDFSVLAHKLAEACNTAKVGEVMRF